MGEGRGRGILLTRPREDSERLKKQLGALGFESYASPLLKIVVREGDFLKESLEEILAGAWCVVFSSANGVRAFGKKFGEKKLREAKPLGVKPLFVMGERSAAEALALGAREIVMAEGQEFKNLVKAIVGYAPKNEEEKKEKYVLHVSGADVAWDLGEALKPQGLRVRREVFYEAEAAEDFSPEAEAALREGRVGWGVFFSARTAGIFLKILEKKNLLSLVGSMEAVCVSASCAEALSVLNLKRVHDLKSASEESVVNYFKDLRG